MNQQVINTAVRINLRSVLILVTGISINLGVFGPLISEKPVALQLRILLILLAFLLSIIFSCCLTVRRRQKVSQTCGSMLAKVELHSQRSVRVFQWLSLLAILPLITFMVYCISLTWTRTTTPSSSTLIAALTIFPCCWGISLGKPVARFWIEDFGRSFELCENGIVICDQLYEWKSPSIQDIFWRRLNNNLVVQLKGFMRILELTETQQHKVRAILDKYYERPKPPNPFATDQT